MLGTGEAYFTDADLDNLYFSFLWIAQNESRLEECFIAAAWSGDPASYVLRVGSFWLNKPEWDPFGTVSIILRSCYYKDLVLSLSERALSFLPVPCGQVKD